MTRPAQGKRVKTHTHTLYVAPLRHLSINSPHLSPPQLPPASPRSLPSGRPLAQLHLVQLGLVTTMPPPPPPHRHRFPPPHLVVSCRGPGGGGRLRHTQQRALQEHVDGGAAVRAVGERACVYICVCVCLYTRRKREWRWRRLGAHGEHGGTTGGPSTGSGTVSGLHPNILPMPPPTPRLPRVSPPG